MKFYIYAGDYDENIGGNIVLHLLCHIINSFPNHQAYIVPWWEVSYHGKLKFIRILKKRINTMRFPSKFHTNDLWNTPVYAKWKIPSDGIVIYPEVVSGNPLNVNRVVRWLLHQPGYFTNEVNYNRGELYFKFSSWINDFSFPGSHTSTNYLKVIHYPTDIYQEDDNVLKNIDVCYMIRKGHYKTMVHGDDAVCLDGLPHKEVASILKRSKRFICYDDYTAYSHFAVLCGCESIVVPSDNVSLIEWHPDIKSRYGIAYGFSNEQLAWAKKTKSKLKTKIEEEHKSAIEGVQICLSEIENYFKLDSIHATLY